MHACLPWLTTKLHLVNPDLTVCLGATAANPPFGNAFRITHNGSVLLDHPDTIDVGKYVPESYSLRSTPRPSGQTTIAKRRTWNFGTTCDPRRSRTADRGAALGLVQVTVLVGREAVAHG